MFDCLIVSSAPIGCLSGLYVQCEEVRYLSVYGVLRAPGQPMAWMDYLLRRRNVK